MENLVSRSSQTEWLLRVRGLLSQLIYWGSSSIADSITNSRLLEPHTVLWSANTQSLLLHMITHYFLSLAGRWGRQRPILSLGGNKKVSFIWILRDTKPEQTFTEYIPHSSADSPSKERLCTRHPNPAATRFWEDKVCLKSPCGTRPWGTRVCVWGTCVHVFSGCLASLQPALRNLSLLLW